MVSLAKIPTEFEIRELPTGRQDSDTPVTGEIRIPSRDPFFARRTSLRQEGDNRSPLTPETKIPGAPLEVDLEKESPHYPLNAANLISPSGLPLKRSRSTRAGFVPPSLVTPATVPLSVNCQTSHWIQGAG